MKGARKKGKTGQSNIENCTPSGSLQRGASGKLSEESGVGVTSKAGGSGFLRVSKHALAREFFDRT